MSSRGRGDLATEHGDLLGKGVKDRSHDLELGRATMSFLSATCLLQPCSVARMMDARYTPATCSLLSGSELLFYMPSVSVPKNVRGVSWFSADESNMFEENRFLQTN
jgi:hypothetical protein